LLANSETFQIGDESYPTQSILGTPSHSLQGVSHEVINAGSIDQNQPFLVNQSGSCLFTPTKPKTYFDNFSDLPDLPDLPEGIKDPVSYDNIFDCQSKVSIFRIIFIERRNETRYYRGT
jgi:hypothetical protein